MNRIETERLIIRQYTERDRAVLHDILSDERTMAFWPAPFTMEQTGQWLDRAVSAYERTGLGRWAVERKADGVLIGDAGITSYEIDGHLDNFPK